MSAPTSPEQKAAFLEALAETANVSRSVHAAGVSRATLYSIRKQDPDFAAAWDEALNIGVDVLEDEATRRGHEGYDAVAAYDKNGEPIVVRRYSDVLLIFMLKGRRPWRYRDNVRLEHSGPDGAPLLPGVDLERLTTEQLQSLESILSAATLPDADTPVTISAEASAESSEGTPRNPADPGETPVT